METIRAKPTTYKGVRFRSKSEARFAVALDIAGLEYEYEPRLDKLQGWKPDFLVKFKISGTDTFDCLIEYKPSKVSQEYLQTLIANGREALKEYPEYAACLLCCVTWYPSFSFIRAEILRRKHEDKNVIANIAKMYILSLWDSLESAGDYRFDLEGGE